MREHMGALEAKQQQRHVHAAAMMEKAHLLAEAEREQARQEFEAALACKNAEVDEFRAELDGIILDVSSTCTAAKRLQQQVGVR